MKIIPLLMVAAVVALGAAAAEKKGEASASVASVRTAAALAEGFARPPASAKPHTWWHWMNGNISKAGITADLEAMKAAGVGGAQIFDIDYGIPEGPVAFNTPAWRDCVVHAAKECERLGLELTLNTASGWSCAGAPWNSVTNGQKFVCTREIAVKGPRRFDAVLELPRPEGWMAKEMRPDRRRGTFYEDLAVFAYPTPVAGSAPAVSNLWTKMFRVFSPADQLRLDAVRGNPGGAVDRDRLVELTAKMAPDGRLVWDVPAGDWTILRVGYCASGRQNYPPSAAGMGTECDKLDARALDLHWAGLMDELIPSCGPGLKGIVIDSYESSVMNWTKNFEEEFRRRRGYEIRPYFPVFVGRVVGSNEETERFLDDYRRTISELFVANFGQHSRAKANACGLKLYLEPYCSLPASPYEYARAADIPMTEFWTFSGRCADWRTTPDSGISDAHVWGKAIVGAESFTTWPKDGRWQLDPWTIKAQTDYQFCNGVNRLIYHTFAHQPWTDDRLVPGMTMGRFGIMFNRSNTWWQMGRAWSAYLARCQYMLQQGRAVADVFCYYGEEPLEHRPIRNGEIHKGSEHDVLTTEALFACRAADGWLVAPSGERVRFLTIPETVTAISARVLERLDRIAEAGVQIIGEPPKRPFGLAGFAAGDRDFKALVARLWARTNVCDRTYARAHVGFVHPAFTRDFLPQPGPAGGGILHTHRVLADGTDIYFLARSKEDASRVSCGFRVKGRGRPELWNAETNEKFLAREWREEGGYTYVTVPFAPRGSMFVVFPSAPTPGLAVEPQWETVCEEPVDGAWEVRFQANRGAPAGPVKFEKLVSWTERPEEGIRYFSGTAVYAKTVAWTAAAERVVLDLGEMQNLATVRLNGKEVGVVWRRPYEIDVTRFLRPGENALEIEVVNKWPNRLIGDEQKPDDVEWVDDKRWGGRHIAAWPTWLADPAARSSGRIAFTTWHHWNKDDPLLPSGLMGPVRFKGLRSSQK